MMIGSIPAASTSAPGIHHQSRTREAFIKRGRLGAMLQEGFSALRRLSGESQSFSSMNFSVESRDIFALVVAVPTLPMSAVCQFLSCEM